MISKRATYNHHYMFGLLKHHRLSKDDYPVFRKNYCGTCKTIGRLYGQKERLLLNNDIVFLSELLTEIRNNPDDLKHIKINSCFDLPAHPGDIPAFLRYTASVNILLGYYKVLDNIEDAKYRLNVWRIARKLQHKNFNKAKMFLEDMKLPIDFIHESITEQFDREFIQRNFDDVPDLLKYYSNMTGKITGKIFQHGAFIINKPDLSAALNSIGTAYGEIVYLCDAVKDYKEDVRENRFNLFRLGNRSDVMQIDATIKQQAYQHLSALVYQVQRSMALLPISLSRANMFVKRIWESLDAIFHSHSACISLNSNKKVLSLRDKIDHALKQAYLFSEESKYNWMKRSRYAFFAGLLIILFIIFPNVIHASQPAHEEPGDCCKCCGDCCCGSLCEGGGCGC